MLAGRHVCFVKVYAQDSRDADLLYRGYRALLLRDPGDEWPVGSLARDVEHEGLLLLLARRAASRCPDCAALVALPDGSMVLAMDDVDGGRSTRSSGASSQPELLDAVWREVARPARAGLAHRALRAANILVTDDGPVIVDFGSAERGGRTPGCRRSTGPSCSSRSPRSSGPRRPRHRRADARPRGPGRREAVPAAARPVGGDAPQASKSLLEAVARRDRRGDRGRAGAARAARPGAAPHAR